MNRLVVWCLFVLGTASTIGCSSDSPAPTAGAAAAPAPAPQDSGAGKTVAGKGRIPAKK